MRKITFIIILVFLVSGCKSNSRFIHFDQSCVSGSDHGELQLFFGNDSCRYFKKTIKKYKKTGLILNNLETNTFLSSALVIHKAYYAALENILKKYADAEPKACVAFYTIATGSNKVLSQKHLSKTDYLDLKNEIQKLNVTYSIDKENKSKIAWYFSIVDVDHSLGTSKASTKACE